MFENYRTFSTDLAGRKLTVETGKMAQLANGSCLVRYGDTAILATATASAAPRDGIDFLPLSVDFEERLYAVGKIPGSFLKREGKPTEKAILTSRVIDRPIRPLFPDGFFNEVQVIIHVLSADPMVDPDIPSMIGASAALMISGIPFKGPIGACRVGYINGEFVCNPKVSQMPESKLDLVVAGTERAVLMVESEADRLSEETMLGAVTFGHEQLQVAINAIHDLVAEAGKPAWDWQPPAKNEALIARIHAIADAGLAEAYTIREKQARNEKLREVYELVEATLNAEAEAAGTEAPDINEVNGILFEMEAHIVRSNILEGKPRIDGRDTRTVRPIEIRQGVLPRTHGSALFTRGETQALVLTTLGTKQDEQIVDSIMGESRERFILHYNMPPFATGETGRVGSPKRREIGHGHLAWRALKGQIPADYPYVVRVVSEILESNGSSSMASVCGASLALMDAGVPIKAAVAGIAMGLVKEEEKFVVLSDILGDEDHLGDMDFKVAGTAKGVTAIQMDIKISGLSREILHEALEQAHKGRMHIMGIMLDTIAEPRQQMSEYAPRIITMKIDPDKIRDVIGSGGKVIRGIIDETGAKIDIEDDGTVFIASVDQEGAAKAQQIIENLTKEVEVGEVYLGKVTRLMAFGAFVEVLPGKEGLVHISKLAKERVENVEDVVNVGDEIMVKVIEIDKQGRINLSRKDCLK